MRQRLKVREKRADLGNEAEGKDENIVSLQVSVDDVLLVQVGQRTHHLQYNTHSNTLTNANNIFRGRQKEKEPDVSDIRTWRAILCFSWCVSRL